MNSERGEPFCCNCVKKKKKHVKMSMIRAIRGLIIVKRVDAI